MLSPRDPLPCRPERVLVAGTSGSGKTTLAVTIGEFLEIPHIEIDALFHGPGWTPRADFVEAVMRFAVTAEWVTEWQYGAVRDALAQRADLLVWLDLRRHVVMRQLVARTVRRRLRREMLWGVNVEPPFRTIFTDREHVVRWAWATHHTHADRIATVRERWPGMPVVRLRSREDAARWLAGPLSMAASAG